MRTYNSYAIIACYLQYFQEIVYHIFFRLSTKTGSTAGGFLSCTAGFFVICIGLSFLCYLKLSQDTYPVTYFPAGFLPQEAAVVVMRYRPSLQGTPS